MCRACSFHTTVRSFSLTPSLFSPSLLLCPSLPPSPPFSPGDHTQHFLFPVGVMSLLCKQSALICQHSSKRFIKIQQAPTKDFCVPMLLPTPSLPLCSRLQLSPPSLSTRRAYTHTQTHTHTEDNSGSSKTLMCSVLDCDHEEVEAVKFKDVLSQSNQCSLIFLCHYFFSSCVFPSVIHF